MGRAAGDNAFEFRMGEETRTLSQTFLKALIHSAGHSAALAWVSSHSTSVPGRAAIMPARKASARGIYVQRLESRYGDDGHTHGTSK